MVDENERPVMQQKRVHPILFAKWLAAMLLLTTWALAIVGFATGNHDYYRWAAYAFASVLVVAASPLAMFVATWIFEKR